MGTSLKYHIFPDLCNFSQSKMPSGFSQSFTFLDGVRYFATSIKSDGKGGYRILKRRGGGGGGGGSG